MLAQIPSADADHVAEASSSAADPFGDHHPHAEEWALHLAAGACLIAGSHELALVAVRHGLVSTDCTRCQDAYLALGRDVLAAMEAAGKTTGLQNPERHVLDGPPFNSKTLAGMLVRLSIGGTGAPTRTYSGMDKPPAERLTSSVAPMFDRRPPSRRSERGG